jgi:hypothetical protein
MKKLLNITLVIAFGLTIAFTGCKKYEDGPTFSLASKKSRVVNTWEIEKSIVNGQDVTASMANYSLEIKKDNTFIESNGISTETGTWDFDSKKENIMVTYNNGEKYKNEILKLKNDEMWLKEVDGTGIYETHYVTK